jgi:AraC family transcriptional regulator
VQHLEPVPVTMGSPQFFSRQTAHFSVTEASFPGNLTLDAHTHDTPILAAMLNGGFRTAISGKSLACDTGVAWTEPLGEKHANVAGAEGAHVIVIQPVAGDDAFLAPFDRLLSQVHRLSDPRILAEAARIPPELRRTDDLNQLCLEAGVVSVLAAATRQTFRDSSDGRPPGWLLGVRDRVHDEWRAALSLSVLADGAGVHPCYLAHSFRDHFGESIGGYARKLRVNWAVRQLAFSNRPISEIAVLAGYSDQPHFTRACRKYIGFSPAEYRRRVGPPARVA